MFTVIWMLRRKRGITFEQFRDHYEGSHAVLGERYLGHLMVSYTRNYNVPLKAPEIAAGPIERAIASKQSDYDCITEWELRDERALTEVFEILFDPTIGKLFHDDEEHFLDRDAVRLVVCDVRKSAASAFPSAVRDQYDR
jgi:hypothetical protein